MWVARISKFSGFVAMLVAIGGLWFSYVYQAIENGLTWVYLQAIVYVAFLVVGLILIAISLLGNERRFALIAVVILTINALAFLVTPYTATPM